MVPKYGPPRVAAQGRMHEDAMRKLFKQFFANESGATAIEYGLIAAGIAVAIITVVGGVGTNLNATFTSVQGDVKFDSTGQNTAATAYLFQWQNGQLIPVLPSSVASAPPEFPKPNWP